MQQHKLFRETEWIRDYLVKASFRVTRDVEKKLLLMELSHLHIRSLLRRGTILWADEFHHGYYFGVEGVTFDELRLTISGWYDSGMFVVELVEIAKV